MNRTFVVGVGMTKFEKPGARDWDYPDMGREAVTKALADAGVAYADVETAAAGYVYGDSTSGQAVLYGVGMTGIPCLNVNNNCSTGSSALALARNYVRGGLVDCALAVGFEKMQPGSLVQQYTDRISPGQRHADEMFSRWPRTDAPLAPQMFGNAARDYMQRYGVGPALFARVAQKNHQHSVNNPNAQFQRSYSLEEIEASPMVHAPLTKLQCCPTSDGGAAAVIASERFVDRHELWDQAVEVVGQAVTTDRGDTFGGSDIDLVGGRLGQLAAEQAYEEAQLGPDDVQVIELHDCFSAMEVFSYESLGLCAAGDAATLVEAGETTYGGRWVVNPSGGLLSKGHPLGATGLAQCAELVWQLRGQAGERQVPNARVGLQHNVGLGGAAVVTIYAGSRT